MNILLTGGAGYIGSHTAVDLVARGWTPVVLDNFYNANPECQSAIMRVTGQRVEVVRGDLRDTALVERVIRDYNIRAVIHFAGLKDAYESISRPTDYYHVNVGGSVSLLKAMSACGVRRLVFSSSASVYGDGHAAPIPETTAHQPKTPYALTKSLTELLFEKLASVDGSDWSIVNLRYFNPAGAHESGLLGECYGRAPPNFFPNVACAANGERACLSIYGSSYETRDGTVIRDFIHVSDLAEGHLAAIESLEGFIGCNSINLGAGEGQTLLEVVRAFERCSRRSISVEFLPPREGDVVVSIADPSRAYQLLGWRARRSLEDICMSAWQRHLQVRSGA